MSDHITTTTVNFRDWILGTGKFSEESLKKARDEFFTKLGKHWSEPMLASVKKAFSDHDAAPAARASLPTADHAVRRGCGSGCGTGDTPAPHPTPPQGSVQGEGSFRDSQNAKEPVAWAVETGGELEASFCGPAAREDAADWREQSDGVIVPLYRHPQTCPHVRGNVTQYCSLNFTLTEEEREAVEYFAVIDGPQFLSAANEHAGTLRRLLERLHT